MGPHAPSVGTGAVQLDLVSKDSVFAAVKGAAPEGVIHLAGFSSVGKSHEDPSGAFAVNALGSTHLLAAIRAHAPKAKVLLVSTGEVYGNVPEGLWVNEGAPLNPLSPYAVSKASAEAVGFQFFRSYGTHVLSARSFNHVGPGQAENFVVPSWPSRWFRPNDKVAVPFESEI